MSQMIFACFDELQKIANEAPVKLTGTPRSRFQASALSELGPAAGAVLGAGVANAYGISPLAGAAGGYGLGAIPEIVHAIRHRAR